MNLLGEQPIVYKVRDHVPGWNKESFFIPDYSERDLEGFGKPILEVDEFYIPPTPPKEEPVGHLTSSGFYIPPDRKDDAKEK